MGREWKSDEYAALGLMNWMFFFVGDGSVACHSVRVLFSLLSGADRSICVLFFYTRVDIGHHILFSHSVELNSGMLKIFNQFCAPHTILPYWFFIKRYIVRCIR